MAALKELVSADTSKGVEIYAQPKKRFVFDAEVRAKCLDTPIHLLTLTY